ncbi:MAG: helix-turn-helix transcriptional regulator [Pyrinomonadaceae bacterium]
MPNINSSSLALRRKRLGYEQKQIAVLLGHKTIHQICRFESDQRIPNLKAAIKLSILYGLPLDDLFDNYFRCCREELENRLESCGLTDKFKLENVRNAAYCSYLELMNSARISESSADQIRHHIKVLIEERSKKILGN